VKDVEELDIRRKTAGTASEAHQEVDIEVEVVEQVEAVEANIKMNRDLRK
jgi:hypothetical protein